MFNKLNLMTYDRVKLIHVGPEGQDNRTPLNDRYGTVIGCATRHIIDYYIVQLDEPYELEGFLHVAVSFPESCLEKI